jgi:serine/threonine protein kinase/Flp pilus assembly protein TadD
MTEREIFLAALKQPTAGERAAFLDQACGSDANRRGQIEALLAEHKQLGSYLEAPVAAGQQTLDEAPATERPGTVIGPYKLLQQIGEGGMGTVYMAEQTQPVQRKVALKVIKPGMDSRQVIARFEAERQALAIMDHVNIARVFDGGTTASGRPYFVMELVHGVPITKYCDDNHLTPRERLELFVPVCQAIQHAHQKGIIHRDIKPSNVMVTLYDGKPVPKVIDFGVAKATEQKLTERTLFTQYGTMVGTLEYMSPEQAEMSALGVDTRSDIYSLGVLLFELLTGSTPLTHKRLKEAGYAEILRIIKEEEPPRPSTRLSDSGEALASISAQRKTEPAKLSKLMRGELDWIVMKTLEKDRNRRYETASAFAADVQRYLDDDPVQACPPSAWYRLRKFARRNRSGLAVGGLILFFLALLGGGGSWLLRDRAVREQEIARDRLMREAALDDEVNRSLDEAGNLIQASRWPDGLGAVQRAQKLLLAAGRQELPARLLELQKDLAWAQRLEDIQSQPTKVQFPWGHDQELDAAYADAFALHGIDVAALSISEAAKLIQARSIRRELSRALDFWSSVRQRCGSQRSPDWKQLTEIAEATDPDPWRNRLREARRLGDHKALETLASSADVVRRPPDTVLLLAAALYDSGGTDRAMALLRRACLHYPENWWLDNQMGWWCLTATPPQLDEAIRYYTACMAGRPRNACVLCRLGDALRQKNANEEAIATYTRAIELQPGEPGPHIHLANALKDKGRLDESIAEWREAIRAKKDLPESHYNLGVVLHHKGQLKEAIAAYREALRLRPDYAEVHINLGVALKDMGQMDEAIVEYRKAIRLNKDLPAAHNNLGVALADKGQLDEAIAEFREAIQLKKDDAAAHNNLGKALYAKGQLDEAIAEYREAIRLQKDYVNAHCGLGSALHEKGCLDEAMAVWREAICLNPDNAFLLRRLAQTKAGFGLWKEAVNDYSRALELHASDWGYWDDRGCAYLNLNEPAKALSDFTRSLALHREAAWVWYHRSITYTQLGIFDRAVADLSKTLELDPTWAAAWNSLAWLLATCPDAKIRDPRRGVVLAKKAVELAPKEGRNWNTLGVAQYRAGDPQAAVAALTKAAELRKGGDAFDWFVLAMAHYQLGNRAEAHEQFDRAVAWMEKNSEALKKDARQAEELRRFRREAEEVLKLKK